MDIPDSAVPGHLRHGDALGACAPPPPQSSCRAAGVVDICVDGDVILLATNNFAGLDPIDREVINGVYDAVNNLMVAAPLGTLTCPTAFRNAVYGNNPQFQDCVILDPDRSLGDGDQVTCDTFAFDAYGLSYRDDDLDGRYDEGEDVAVDVNANGIFD